MALYFKWHEICTPFLSFPLCGDLGLVVGPRTKGVPSWNAVKASVSTVQYWPQTWPMPRGSRVKGLKAEPYSTASPSVFLGVRLFRALHSVQAHLVWEEHSHGTNVSARARLVRALTNRQAASKGSRGTGERCPGLTELVGVSREMPGESRGVTLHV